MRHTFVFALVLGALAAGITSPQSLPSDLISYLTLTDAQVQSINSSNVAFNQYTGMQVEQYYRLQLQAQTELAKDSPDPGVVGGLYGQMAMFTRDYNTQLAQVQSNVAAVLTTAQAMLASGLLDVVRLQPLVSEAQCVDMEPQSLAPYTGIPVLLPGTGTLTGISSTTSCSVPPVPNALTNYLNLSDAQVSAIENAIQGNQDYLSRQSLQIQELQYQIKDLTAAQTIDTAALGNDYVAIAQIQRDETTQAGQLTNAVRSILTDQQQPQLKALDNAAAVTGTASEAVSANILVLPPDLAQACPFPTVSNFLQPGVCFPQILAQLTTARADPRRPATLY